MTPQWHVWDLPSQDIGGPFNARARSFDDDQEAALRAYHTLDEAGTPLARAALPPQLQEEPENNWEVVDYIELNNQTESVYVET